jgi:hypothetical protein
MFGPSRVELVVCKPVSTPKWFSEQVQNPPFVNGIDLKRLPPPAQPMNPVEHTLRYSTG